MKFWKIYNCDYRELGDLKERFGEFVIVTDPPFNIGYRYASYKDKIDEEEYLEMLAALIQDRPSVIGILPGSNLTVIDPFMGSGTTGAAIAELNREKGREPIHFIGIDIDKEYCRIAEERMKQYDK